MADTELENVSRLMDEAERNLPLELDRLLPQIKRLEAMALIAGKPHISNAIRLMWVQLDSFCLALVPWPTPWEWVEMCDDMHDTNGT